MLFDRLQYQINKLKHFGIALINSHCINAEITKQIKFVNTWLPFNPESFCLFGCSIKTQRLILVLVLVIIPCIIEYVENDQQNTLIYGLVESMLYRAHRNLGGIKHFRWPWDRGRRTSFRKTLNVKNWRKYDQSEDCREVWSTFDSHNDR
jgi:hypothetical protein